MDIRANEVVGGLRLQPWDAADEPFLLRLFASTREADFAALPLPEAQKAVFVQTQFAARERSYRERFPNAERWLVLCGAERVGCLVVDVDATEVRVVDVALLAEWRGRGWGTALLRHVHEEAVDLGLPVRLQVESGNPARRLYDRLGFRVISSDGVYEQRELLT